MSEYQIPAFPSGSLVNKDTGEVVAPASQGMSLRDWFAGMAMQGIHASYTQGYPDPKITAEIAYEQADAMLLQREKGKP